MPSSYEISTNEQSRTWLAENPELMIKLKRTLMCSSEEAASGLEEAVKFMHLAAAQQPKCLTPSHRVDLVWHEMILFTRSYARFCQDHFGRFIHHQPSGEQAKNSLQFQETLRCYEEQFGVAPDRFWGTRDSSSACGTCEAAES